MSPKELAIQKLNKSKDYFLEFTRSQQFIGLLLLFCTTLSLLIANSCVKDFWLNIIHYHFFNVSVQWIVNDVLMAFFFLLVTLEIRRELAIGELSNRKTASLPIAGAIGGMVVPAIIYLYFNSNDISVKGWAIPIATDIAFAVGILNLLGNRIPLALKIFVTALAVVDDLGAVAVIAVFYSSKIVWVYFLLLILFVPVAKYILKRFKTLFYPTYIIIGILIFWLLYHAQLHTTLSGVILAAITPYSKDLNSSKLNNIEHLLFKPVNYLIVPIFAIFNTAIVVDTEIINAFNLNLFLGIFIGLVIGKPIGITIFSYIACKLKIAELPTGSKISELFLVSILGGIGFTMSIFISLLAFNETFLIEQAKVAVLLASFIACLIGYVSLKMVFKPIST